MTSSIASFPIAPNRVAAAAAILFSFFTAQTARASLVEPPPAAAAHSAGSASRGDSGDPSDAIREEVLSLAREGRLDSASALCAKALKSHPGDAFLLLMLGKLSPDGRESAAYFKKAMQAGADSKEAEESLFRLGQFQYAEGKYHLAIPAFRDYLRAHPDGDWREPAGYWMGNACLALAQSRRDRAAYLDSGAVWFQRMLDASRPEAYYYPLALEGLAKAKAFQGDREGAWRAARTAMERSPEEERSALMLLSARLRQGVDRKEEKEWIARLLAHYPHSPEARYLRKVNSGADSTHWTSGSGFPAPASGSKETSGLPPAADPGYTLQLGAFSQASNAKSMIANLEKLGFRPELVESMRGGKPLYQVRLGRFPDADSAAGFGRLRLKPHQFLSQPVPIAP